MLLGKGTGRRLLVHRGLHLTNSGAWRRTVTIPQWHGSLSARLSLYLRYPDDVRPDYRSFRTPDLKAAGVTNRLTIKGPADTTAPTLDAFSFSPDVLDTTSDTEELSVNATIHDAQAGVSIAYVAFFHHHHPPTRFSRGYGAGLHLTQQDGDSWSGSVTVPQCVGTHKWQADVYLYDAAGNRLHARPGRLADAGFPTKVSVTSAPLGDTESPWVNGSSAFAPDHSITLDFTEGVKNVSTDTLVVYDATPSPDRFTSTAPISSITCSDGSSTVDCDGSGGLATSAVLIVPSLVGAHRYAVYANPDPEIIQLTDGVGNPITTSYEQVARVEAS
jgi:hypothetical protein